MDELVFKQLHWEMSFRTVYDDFKEEIGGDLNQHTPAPNVPATVAPFRAWRDLQLTVTKGPKQVTIASAR